MDALPSGRVFSYGVQLVFGVPLNCPADVVNQYHGCLVRINPNDRAELTLERANLDGDVLAYAHVLHTTVVKGLMGAGA